VVMSGARCRLFAYGPADATASQTPSSLASFKFRPVSPFWYQFTQVVLEKWPLNGCTSSSCSQYACLVTMSLVSVKSRLVLPFLYQLTQVVLEKRPLNGRSSSSKNRASGAERTDLQRRRTS